MASELFRQRGCQAAKPSQLSRQRGLPSRPRSHHRSADYLRAPGSQGLTSRGLHLRSKTTTSGLNWQADLTMAHRPPLRSSRCIAQKDLSRFRLLWRGAYWSRRVHSQLSNEEKFNILVRHLVFMSRSEDLSPYRTHSIFHLCLDCMAIPSSIALRTQT